MTSPYLPSEELRQLLATLTDGDLTAAQTRRLAEILRQDRQARAYYLDHAALVTSLQWEYAALAAPSEPCRPGPRPARSRRGSQLVVLAMVGLSGLAAGLLLALTLPWVRPQDVPAPAEPLGEGEVAHEGEVAQLTRAVNARWDDTGMPTTLGAALPVGRLQLTSGLAQLEFYSGAIVVLEGPADFELLGTDRGFCHKGKLRAKLSPHSRGFTVKTPGVDVVDLGTEFGLQIDETGAGEVHVFDGKVELHSKGSDPAARQEVDGGFGVRIDPAGALRPTAAKPESFVGVVELEQRLFTELQRRYRAWLESSRKLRADPRLLHYYSFEGQQRWDRTLSNQGPGQSGERDGAIIGCQWIEGRWPGKGALEFKRPDDRVRIHVSGEYDSLTWMAWVRIDNLDHRFNSLLLTDGFEVGAPHWQLVPRGCVVLGVQGATRHQNFRSPWVLGPDKLGRWIHLATVYDRQAQMVRHYVNGQVVHSERIHEPVRLRLGNAEIGNWGAPTSAAPIRSFNGQMDEFALFGQALTADEIQRLYEDGKP